MNRVLLLHAPLRPGPGPAELDALLARLPYAKRQELERRDSGARYAGLAGVALALQGLGELLGEVVDAGQLRFPEGGKPFLPGGPCYSISHARTTVAVALSRDCELGLDVEEEAGPGASSSGAAVKEIERLAWWTATEAVLKAAGHGLRDVGAVELDASLASGRVGDAVFRLTRVGIPGAVAHLATSAPVTSLAVEVCFSSAFTCGA